MLNIKKYLDKASGYLFSSGFIISKLQYLPIAAAALFRFIAPGIYLAAYGTWFVASYQETGHDRVHGKWYGFARVKEQFLFSSLIGLIATAASIAALFIPALLPPATWLFFLGNTLWAIGEYHKLNSQPTDKNFSYTQQEVYVSYTASITAISFVTAVSATLIFCFPPLVVPLTTCSFLLCTGLGTLAFEYWLSSNLGNHQPTSTSSYSQMGTKLGPSTSPMEPTKVPEQTQRLSINTKGNKTNPDLAPRANNIREKIVQERSYYKFT